MLKIIGIIILIGIVFALLKYMLAFIIRFTAIGICSFLIVGALTGFLALVNVISSGTAWTLSIIASIIGLGYNLYQVSSRPSKAISDVNNMYHKDYRPKRYDNYGNEIDFYEEKRCCGNCVHNMSRSAEKYMDIYCTWDSFYHSSMSYSQTNVCEHWEHF